MKKIVTQMILGLVFFLLFILILPIFYPINLMAQKASAKPFPESQFVDIEGINIHFRSWKSQKSTTKGRILMVHGFCGSTFSWRKNIPFLTQNSYETVAVDLPPFGYSEKKRKVNHSISAQARLLWQFLDYQNALAPNDSSKWILMGHSMGGGVIAAMAAMRPTEIKSLVFVDAAIMTSNKNSLSGLSRWFFGTNYMYKLGEFAGRYFFFNEKKIHKLLISAYGCEPDNEAVKGYLSGMNQGGTAGGIMEMSASKELYDFNIAQITAPALLIWGDKDTWVPLKNADVFKNRLKSAEVSVVKGAAHCAMETHSDTFNDLVLRFLEK